MREVGSVCDLIWSTKLKAVLSSLATISYLDYKLVLNTCVFISENTMNLCRKLILQGLKKKIWECGWHIFFSRKCNVRFSELQPKYFLMEYKSIQLILLLPSVNT